MIIFPSSYTNDKRPPKGSNGGSILKKYKQDHQSIWRYGVGVIWFHDPQTNKKNMRHVRKKKGQRDLSDV